VIEIANSAIPVHVPDAARATSDHLETAEHHRAFECLQYVQTYQLKLCFPATAAETGFAISSESGQDARNDNEDDCPITA